MEITVKLISQINSATKPLACDCFDLRGRTRSHCPVCDGKGGMKSCSTCGGAGMSPDGSMQVRVCSECKGRGYGVSADDLLPVLDLRLHAARKSSLYPGVLSKLEFEMPSVVCLRGM
jgi:hypothetical protein